MKQPFVSIVTVNWNGKKDTIELIKSLKNITYKNHEIIMVDNGSSDNSQKEIKRLFPKVKVIENGENLGLAEGSNVGIRVALKNKADYVLLMNNDMTVKPDFLEILVNQAEKHPEVAVCGPKIYYWNEPKRIWSAGLKYKIYNYFHIGQDEMDSDLYNKTKIVDAVDCVLFMKSSALGNVGLLDPSLFIICELSSWCSRAVKKGYKCLFVPESVVWHKVMRSVKNTTKKDSFILYYNIRNNLIVTRKIFGHPRFLLVLFLDLYVLSFYRIAKFLFIKKNPSLIYTYIHAIYDGIKMKTPKRFIKQ